MDEAPFEEGALLEALEAVTEPVEAALGVEDYADALSSLASLRPQVDAFLDGVLVNSPKAEERANRLRLLAGVRDLMGRAADFSLVTG
jgi:glycyl-tRNA synthetase beta chain